MSDPAPLLDIDLEAGTLRLQIAYTANSDSKRCPAHACIGWLLEQADPKQRSDLTSIAIEGDRTLSFTWRRPDLDRSGLAVTVAVIGVVGPCYHRATRRLTLSQAAGVILAPSPVEGYEGSARRVLSEVRDLLEPSRRVCALQWVTNSGRPERDPTELFAELGIPTGVPSFVMDRRSGHGVRGAFEDVVGRVLSAYDEGRWRPPLTPEELAELTR